MAAAELGDVPAKKRSDLPLRTASAVVMVTVAGAAFWLGGWFLTVFILALGLGIFAEWVTLALLFERSLTGRALWLIAGAAYIGCACRYALLLQQRSHALLWVVGSVIAVDVGAYFAGRTFRGPKIAPAISPSKTWSGLAGAVFAATTVFAVQQWVVDRALDPAIRVVAANEGLGLTFGLQLALLLGLLVAVVAQSGDFFESWMKRRAGVKDSGRLIPGHGGLFDRSDGLIAVLFVLGLFRIFGAIVVR